MAKKQDEKKTELDKLSFEQAIEALTGIVDKIETGQVPLAESLQQYEKGMAMIKHCRKILRDAEKRIDRIAEDKNEPDAQMAAETDRGDEEDKDTEEDEVLF
jgi:exodeoxyribonuclease VII small subunit